MDARTKAQALLEVERDTSLAVICDWFRRRGARLQVDEVPEEVRAELTRLCYAAMDLGHDYAHEKDTIPMATMPREQPAGVFGEPPRRSSSSQRMPAIEPKARPRDRSRR
jgi:hypothetical protein